MSKNNWHRHISRVARYNKNPYKSRNYRFVVNWENKGVKYECIYGYGVDPDKDVWNDIKDISYNFSKIEKEIIDTWFN